MALDAIVLIGVIATVLLLLALLSKLNMQVKNTHDDLQNSTKTIEKDMNCIGTFFSLPDRSNLQISNLRKCTIKNTKTNQESPLPLTGSGFAPTPAFAPIGTSDTAPTSGTSTPPNPHSNDKASPTPPNNPTPPSQPGVVQRIISNITDTVKTIL